MFTLSQLRPAYMPSGVCNTQAGAGRRMVPMQGAKNAIESKCVPFGGGLVTASVDFDWYALIQEVQERKSEACEGRVLH